MNRARIGFRARAAIAIGVLLFCGFALHRWVPGRSETLVLGESRELAWSAAPSLSPGLALETNPPPFLIGPAALLADGEDGDGSGSGGVVAATTRMGSKTGTDYPTARWKSTPSS